MQKEKAVRILSTAVLIGVLAALWGRESNLAYNVAQQRPILLGRYTLEKTMLLLAVSPVLLLMLRRLWKKNKPVRDPQARRTAFFKRISLAVSILIALIFADVALRLIAGKKKTYVGDEGSYHRAPGQVYRGTFHDRPEFAFSYPNATAGYPPVPYVLTVDQRGFRNPEAYDSCDWIVLGDSFAEGSSVSDEYVWVARLAEQRGLRIYNLGMSGGSPVTYLDTLRKFGIELRPRVALYMLYEGNDLRDSNFRRQKLEAPKKTGLSDRLFKMSPLRHLIKDSLVRLLGPVGKNRFAGDPSVHDPEHRMYPVSWLPIEIPAESGYGYAFDVKRVEQHLLTDERFRQTRAFAESTRLFKETAELCKESGIQLIFIYAPDTPHVMMEDLLERVPDEQIHAFMGTRLKRLPDPSGLTAALHEGSLVRERIFRELCTELGVPFLSLTEPLRQKTRAGVRTYYTYDQHWTPDGHEVIAAYLNEHLPRQAE